VVHSFLLLSRISPTLFPGMTRERDLDGIERCEWVCGAALMTRREVLDAVHWNEDLFLLAEDVDFCARALDRGWHIAATGEAEVLHRAGRSFTAVERPDHLAGQPSAIARELRRRHGPVAARLAIAAMKAGMALRHLAHLALYRLGGDPERLHKANKLRIFLELDTGEREATSEPRRPRAGPPGRRTREERTSRSASGSSR
jgi:GT2 family glycosyltransferase